MKRYYLFQLVFVSLVWSLSVINASKVSTIDLLGGVDLESYFLEVFVGSPFQALTAAVDTSVMGIALPTETCVLNRVPSQDSCMNGFNESSSSSFHQIYCSSNCTFCINSDECGFQYGRPDGSVISGALVIDELRFGENEIFKNFTFQTFDVAPSQFFSSEINGVFGLGLPENTKAAPDSVFQRWVEDNGYDKVFSFCLGEFGGKMVLGGVNSTFVGSPIQYTPMYSLKNDYYDSPQYIFDVTDIIIDGQSVLYIPPSDSGDVTTFAASPSPIPRGRITTEGLQMVVPVPTFLLMRSVFEQQYCVNEQESYDPDILGICGEQTFFDGFCFVLDDRTISKYPTIELVLNDTKLSIPPSNYFYDYEGRSCLAIKVTKYLPHITLGTRIMQQYYTIFDVGQGKIGFADAVNCSGALYIASYVSGDSQTSTVATQLEEPFVVKVTFFDGTPVANLKITFDLLEYPKKHPGGVEWAGMITTKGKIGTLSPVIAYTDANGIAKSFLTVSNEPGNNIVAVDIPYCLNHVVFTAYGRKNTIWIVLWFATLFVLLVALICLYFWFKKVSRSKTAIFGSTRKVQEKEEMDVEDDPFLDGEEVSSINSEYRPKISFWNNFNISRWFKNSRKGKSYTK